MKTTQNNSNSPRSQPGFILRVLGRVEAVGSIAAMGYEVDSEHYVSGIKKERRQALNKILAKVAYPEDKIRAIFQIGHPVEELLKIAMRENVDMIVMGIKGRSDLEYILVGSVAWSYRSFYLHHLPFQRRHRHL